MLKNSTYLCLITCALATPNDGYSITKNKDCIKLIRCTERGTNENCHAYLDMWTLKGKFISKPFPPSVRRCSGGLNESHSKARHNFIYLFPPSGAKDSMQVAIDSLNYISGEGTSASCHLNESLPPIAPPAHRCDESILKKELRSVETLGKEAAQGIKSNAMISETPAVELQKLSRSELQRSDWLP